MIEWVLLVALIVNVVFLAWIHERGLRQNQQAMTAALRDKAKLVDLLRETMDRVQAGDPSQFAMLRGISTPPTGRAFSRSDEEEARIAESRGNGAR